MVNSLLLAKIRYSKNIKTEAQTHIQPSLILAALAADALPGLRFVHIQDVSDPDAELVTALLTTADGQQVILKSPKSQIAMTHLGLEVRALRILRNVELPFRVPALLGEKIGRAHV